MFAVKRCVKDIFGTDVKCEDIKMIYFSPEKKAKIAEIRYSEAMFRNDEKKIYDLVDKIYNYDYSKFEKESCAKQCKFCEFANFCNSEISEEIADFGSWNFEEIDEVCV